MIKIAVFTSTRAEYGLMKTLILKLQDDISFDFTLLVSGTHLNPKFGNTIEEIKKDGIKNIQLVPISTETHKKEDMNFQTAELIKSLSIALRKINPRYLLILGDRFETLGAAFTGHILGLKNVHLHGGETSLGALDNKLRNAISQLSSYHFTSSEVHKNKVIKIVGSDQDVYNVGPLVIDGLLQLKPISKKEFENKTGFSFSINNFLITFHSETLSKDFGIKGFLNLLESLENNHCSILFTAPNADVGSERIMELIEKYLITSKNKVFYIPSLGQELYLNALILFDCVMGNSSSGIIEAPLLKTKVINVGNRQKGRYRFGSIIDVSNDVESISNAIKSILNLDKGKEAHFEEFKSSYYKKSPSFEIIKTLKNTF